MESSIDQVLSMGEELSSKGNHEVGGVPTLLVLHFGCHDNHFGRRVLHFDFFEDGGCVAGDEDLVYVVDDHFFHA